MKLEVVSEMKKAYYDAKTNDNVIRYFDVYGEVEGDVKCLNISSWDGLVYVDYVEFDHNYPDGVFCAKDGGIFAHNVWEIFTYATKHFTTEELNRMVVAPIADEF